MYILHPGAQYIMTPRSSICLPHIIIKKLGSELLIAICSFSMRLCRKCLYFLSGAGSEESTLSWWLAKSSLGALWTWSCFCSQMSGKCFSWETFINNILVSCWGGGQLASVHGTSREHKWELIPTACVVHSAFINWWCMCAFISFVRPLDSKPAKVSDD